VAVEPVWWHGQYDRGGSKIYRRTANHKPTQSSDCAVVLAVASVPPHRGNKRSGLVTGAERQGCREFAAAIRWPRRWAVEARRRSRSRSNHRIALAEPRAPSL